MIAKFFEEIQRHYESRSKPIGKYYTISQAVFELRNQFHAHVKQYKEALVLSLNSNELDRIREQLKASRDEATLLFDYYRSAQRESARKREIIATQYAAPPPTIPGRRPLSTDLKNMPARNTQSRGPTLGVPPFCINICILIYYLPAGSQACTRDVADAYRTIPLHPSQWPGLVVRLDSNSFAVNTQNSFGLTSAGGIWGHVADLFADLFRSQGLGPVCKWVDDFVFFRIPRSTIPQYNKYRSSLQPSLIKSQHNARVFFEGPPLPDGTYPQYDEDFVFPVQQYSDPQFSFSPYDLDSFSQRIGLPWKHDKSTPFADTFTYLGFLWNLSTRTVTLHPLKRAKYQAALQEWNSRPFHSLLQVQSLYGKLLHTTYVCPEGRLYLTGLERMLPTFDSNPNRPHRPVKNVGADLLWWEQLLSFHSLSRPLPQFTAYNNLLAYSDASSKGIGLVVGHSWAAFHFSNSFRQRNRDIAWAEAAALQLLVLALDHFPLSSRRFLLHCDNSVVTEGWKVGRSRNIHINEIFKHIHSYLQARHFEIQLSYVPSEFNPADLPSKGQQFNGPHLPFFPLPANLEHDLVRCFHSFPESSNFKLCPLPSNKLLPKVIDFCLSTDCEQFN
ncbi:reverse transcriptase ribonuclease H [Pyrrhoderma noxium]|uniref:Reverse transcriptase ribonuclease H n=1 Tax=Pyrrhoderma noxium TaxID=2282107 RepID=A0A286UJD4_9AGAM|nr:reverse transcriptase ribonuclease H [Pyrrhoderma noxium]